MPMAGTQWAFMTWSEHCAIQDSVTGAKIKYLMWQAESQKGVITIQRYSSESQMGTVAIDFVQRYRRF